MATKVPVTESPCGLEYSVHRELVTEQLLLRKTSQSCVHLATVRRVPSTALERSFPDFSWLDG